MGTAAVGQGRKPSDVPARVEEPTQSAETLDGLIEAAARARPEAIAVEYDAGVMTFAQLLSAADRVAQGVRAAGVVPDTPVALFGATSPLLVAGAVGIMRAGAAYLPVDPSDPENRRRVVCDAARPPVVVTDPESAPAARSIADTVVEVEPSSQPASVRSRSHSAHNLAYVLFTSGSTGRPKGVMVEHRNVVNYVRWAARAQRVGESVPAVPVVTKLGFDASVQQVLAPLARGDRVWIPPRDAVRDPEILADQLARRPGSALHCVPSLWQQVLEVVESERPDLRLAALYLGGEVVNPALWERTRAALPEAALANVYGPTEATVQVTGGFQPPGASLTVGRPIHGAFVRVLAADLAPVAPGTEGEVWIGGKGVARGYLGDPAATAEGFLADPVTGERLYRSGDAGALTPDGLTIVGRLDDQVKVRGYRIEPAEVEAALMRHPAVAEAAIAVVDAHTPEARIRALVVPRKGHDAHPDDVRRFVEDALPSYMVPSEIVAGGELPRTANGKLDRRGVLLVQRDLAPREAAAAGDVDPRIAELWEHALGVASVAPDDDFFALGGHSLLATAVVARVRKALGVKVPLGVLFDHPTLGGFSRAVRALSAPVEGAPPPAGGDSAPLSLQQEEAYGDHEMWQGLPVGNVMLLLEANGELDEARLRDAIDAVVSRHRVLRTAFTGGETLRQVAAPPGPVEHESRDLRTERRGARAAARNLVRALHARPVDLAAGPLVRSMCLRIGDARWILAMALHHIASDGLSLRIIAEDLVASYAGPPPPPPPMDYLDFATRQRRDLEAGALEEQTSHWARALRAAFARTPLFDHGERTFRMRSRRVVLDAATSEAVATLAAARSLTPFAVYSAAFAAALHVDRRLPVWLATLAANREDLAVERAVGPFATTVLFEVAPGAAESAQDLLGEVKESLVAALRNQAVPPAAVPFDAPVRSAPAPFDAAIALEPEAPVLVAARVGFRIVAPTLDDAPSRIVPGAPPLALVVRAGGETVVDVEFDDTVLDPDRVGALTARFVEALRLFSTEPEAPSSVLWARLSDVTATVSAAPE